MLLMVIDRWGSFALAKKIMKAVLEALSVSFTSWPHRTTSSHNSCRFAVASAADLFQDINTRSSA